MSNDVDKSIQNLLLPGENILWNGSPSLSKIFVKRDISFILFFVFAGLMTVIVWVTDDTSSVPSISELLTEPFVIVSAFMCVIFVIQRMIIRKSIRQRTMYVMTNVRVLVVVADSQGLNESVSSLKLGEISDESVSWDKNGVGTIFFGTSFINNMTLWDKRFNYNTGSLQYGIISFFDIEDCEYVFNIYKNAKKLK